MSYRFNVFTGTLDLTGISGAAGSLNFSFNLVDIPVTIPADQQMIVYKKIVITDTLIIDGQLVIIDSPSIIGLLDPMQIAFGSPTSEIIGSNALEWDDTNRILTVNGKITGSYSGNLLVQVSDGPGNNTILAGGSFLPGSAGNVVVVGGYGVTPGNAIINGGAPNGGADPGIVYLGQSYTDHVDIGRDIILSQTVANIFGLDGTSGSAGGTIAITGGNGDDTGNGGIIVISGGSSGSGVSGDGGKVSIQGGGATSTNGNGADVEIFASVGNGAGNGGNILIDAGTGAANGVIYLAATNADRIQIGAKTTIDENSGSAFVVKDSVTTTRTNFIVDTNLQRVLANGTSFVYSDPTGATPVLAAEIGGSAPSGGGISIVRSGDPTAKLHIGAGTATASTAPIKLTSGTHLASIEDGVFEYNGTHLFFSIGATRYQIDQQIAGGGAVTGTGTSGQVTFWNGTSSITSDADMTFATDTLTVTKIIGSTSITDSGLTAGRITFAGTAGLLSDDADLTFSTDTLSATKIKTTSLGILEGGGSPTKYSFFVGGDQAADITYTLPVAAPASNGYILSGTTGGVLSWAAPTTSASVFVGSLTRAAATASGSQAITGVGFRPKVIYFNGLKDGTTNVGTSGWGNGTVNTTMYVSDALGTSDIHSDVIWIQTSTGNGHNASITSLDSDGFTLNWSKLGVGADITVKYTCIG